VPAVYLPAILGNVVASIAGIPHRGFGIQVMSRESEQIVKLAMMFVMETETKQEEEALLESIKPIAQGIFPLAQHPFPLPDGLPLTGGLPQLAQLTAGDAAMDAPVPEPVTDAPLIGAVEEPNVAIEPRIMESSRCVTIDAYIPHLREVPVYPSTHPAPLEKACQLLEEEPQSSMFLDVVA
jgi:hypothetical protein